jgi:hypothetical protein
VFAHEVKTIGGICDDKIDAIVGHSFHDVETITLDDFLGVLRGE